MAKTFAYQYKLDHSITIFANGKLVTIEKDALNYDIVLDALKRGDQDTVERNLTVRQAIADHTDGRVEIFGDEIFLDKKPIHPALNTRIMPMFKNGFNLKPLFRFLENVSANPSQTSRDELYLFLDKNDLPITPDGHFLAYKMVQKDYTDCYTGSIDNHVGMKPFMPREEVDDDRQTACSQGLHFCSFNYLSSGYGGPRKRLRLMVLKINPADVVSIPYDYKNAKGRCWTYEVVEELPNYDDTLTGGYTDSYGIDDSEEESEEEEYSDSYSEEDSYSNDEEDLDEELEKSHHSSQKLDEDDVREIRLMLNDGWTLRAIADTFDISSRQVARIRDRENWVNVK